MRYRFSLDFQLTVTLVYYALIDDPPVVSVESYTSTTISVSVSWMSTSRDPDGFVVVWRRDTMAGYCPDEDIGNFTVSDGSAKYIISGLEEASHYSIIVRRAKLVSEAVVGMTGETGKIHYVKCV